MFNNILQKYEEEPGGCTVYCSCHLDLRLDHLATCTVRTRHRGESKRTAQRDPPFNLSYPVGAAEARLPKAKYLDPGQVLAETRQVPALPLGRRCPLLRRLCASLAHPPLPPAHSLQRTPSHRLAYSRYKCGSLVAHTAPMHFPFLFSFPDPALELAYHKARPCDARDQARGTYTTASWSTPFECGLVAFYGSVRTFFASYSAY